MASTDRFYQLDFRHRSVLRGDIGSMLKIDGLVVGGCGAGAVLLLPSADEMPRAVIRMSDEEWSEYLQRSDVPEILMPEKAFHRKARYEISGLVQQKIWVADGLICVYCRRPMGKVQLTIDHFIPLEMGGVNDPSNYLSACRKCNKDKGSMDPREYVANRTSGFTYEFYVQYLKNRVL